MKGNISLNEAPLIVEVAKRNIVTLLMLTNSTNDQSVDQPINRRSEGALHVCPGNIGPPSMTLACI